MSYETEKTYREVHLKARPDALPGLNNFEIVEVPIPQIGKGEFLVRNDWLSVDPYMRGRMNEGDSYVEPFALGKPMEGGCVGTVVASQNEDFSEGDVVLGNEGWREFWKSGGESILKIDPELAEPRHFLSILGLTGMTAYVGLFEIGDLQENETVFVSAASGAVGSIACQLARLKGCRVIASAGSARKRDWLINEAGVDEVIIYRESENLAGDLGKLVPKGIDVYFDNVGGEHLEAAIEHMNHFSRIICCGMISTYNAEKPEPAPRNLMKVIGKRLRMQGFIVRDHEDQREGFLREMADWMADGKIAWEETITEGIENAPEAFLSLFQGQKKIGKVLVKI